VTLTRAPAALVLREQRPIDLELLGQVRHSLLRYLGGILREPAVDLEEFEQRGKPQSSRPRLAANGTVNLGGGGGWDDRRIGRVER
jgi:hypothetical protein